MTSASTLIRVRDLSIHYGPRRVLREVNLDIPAAKITALVGPSGCGKSSFLMALNRLSDLVPTCRVDGDIQLGETEVLAPRTDVTALRPRVGTICQTPSPFPF